MSISGRTGAGFTLLEVLIALLVFAVIGLAAYRLLTTVLDAEGRVALVTEEHRALALAFTRLERDLIQFYPRQVRDARGEPAPPLQVATGAYPLEFSRLGWRNPAGHRRGQVQRVAWRLEDGRLQRLFWTATEPAPEHEPRVQLLLDGVLSMRVELLLETGERLDVWPPPEETGGFPAAVEVTLETARQGRLHRLVPLVAPPLATVGAAVGAAPGGG